MKSDLHHCCKFFITSFLLLSSIVLLAQNETQNPTFPYWKLRGNSNTDTAINFVGTTDNVGLTFRTANVRRVTIDVNGNTGIGTVLPQEKLHLFGVGSTARIAGVGTGGSFLLNTTATTDKLLYGDANGTVKGLPNGPAGTVLVIGSPTLAPTWRSSDSLFWKLTGNNGINEPATPATYGTSAILATENWIGTIDNKDYVIGTNTIERMRVKKTTGLVGIGTAAPSNRLTLQHNVITTPGTTASYPFAINSNTGTLDYTIGSNATLVYEQSWAKPLLINSQGNFVGVNLTTAPIQNLDVNGRVNVANGVIQRGTTAITATNDLGLYQQVAGNWIRFASNAAPIKFFTDQGGANGAGTNATMSVDNTNGGGVMIAAETGGTGNAGAPYARAALELNSITKGFLTPRLTTVQRDAMGNTLTEGLLIYNTTNDCFEWWDTKSAPAGGNGFWNSLCKWCESVVIITTNQTGFNLNSYLGGALAQNYCVYINAGVTLQAAGNGGGSGAAGGAGFDASTMPAGASITLYNYGSILAGGGNGGYGGRESDLVCSGDICPQTGGAGGHAILTNSSVPIRAFNYGIIRGGGGGGGGGGTGCCAASGGGGGGAGTPPGSGGAGQTSSCTQGFVCTSCSRNATSAAGSPGTALTGGGPGGGSNSGSTGCPTCNGRNAQSGGNGGVNAVAGNAGGTSGDGTACGNGAGAAGGGAGQSLRGNGSGSSLSNISGTVTGAVSP